MTLRLRLFVLVSVIVVITVVLVTATVTWSARRSFAALDAQRTTAMVTQFRREFASEADEIALRLDRVAATETVLRTAMDVSAGRDSAPHVDDAEPLAVAQGLDFLDVVAADGTIISSAHWPARFGYRHPWLGGAPSASGDVFLQDVELPRDRALGLVAVRTVTAGASTVYVAGGRQLDARFLQSLVLPPGMRVLLYRNLEPEVTGRQLIAASGDATQQAPLEPLIARVRESGKDAAENIAWPDGEETVNAIPLTGRNGRVLGVLLVGSSGRELAALVRNIRWSGIAFGGLGVILALAASYVLASRVTRPVEQLAEAAREVAGGQWDVRVDHIHSSGEVASLASAFDTMTRQLVDHRARLVQAERVAAWRELARRLAHELKNPLFPLRITLDNLRRAKPLPPADFDEVFEESVGTLTTGLANLNTVIGRFSDFSKMPAPELAEVPVNAVVERAVALLKPQFSAPGAPPIAVTVDLDAAAGSIHADAEQLGRALQNLLLNAVDAMPGGGTLIVRTRRGEETVRLEVADTGQGLTEEEASRLFTPYYTTKQHGTGLGLAIVQAIVADHGGRIWVESAPGRGASFHIELHAGSAA
jgi:two-component system, NtrC family, nitrogen regulation sensor histidine kinase NtrY